MQRNEPNGLDPSQSFWSKRQCLSLTLKEFCSHISIGKENDQDCNGRFKYFYKGAVKVENEVSSSKEDFKKEFRKAKSEYGDICISLRYVPVTQKLFVYVLECKNLKATDAGGVSDPYVRLTLVQNGKKIKRRKTRVKKETTDPYYNEEFQFNIAPDKIEKSAIQFLVMDYDLIGKADIIGQVTIGANTYGPQLRQWRDMLQFPRKPIAQWHMLRPKPKPGEED